MRKNDGYEFPRQILIEELKAETRSPWWEIVGCIASRSSGEKQLITYARVATADYYKVLMSVFQSGVLTERFAPGFSRYVISLRSKNAWPGFAAFDGEELRRLREQQRPFEEYGQVMENKLLFYVPRIRVPRISSKIETFSFALRLHAYEAIAEFRRRMALCETIPRNLEIHRNAWGCVLNGKVWLRNLDQDVDQDSVRNSCRRIIRAALSQARRESSWFNVVKFLPLGFARIALFRTNYRRRRLSGFGLGDDLICTIQVQRLGRIRTPDIMGSTIEQYGRYRIAWNKAWLEDIGCAPAQ